MFRRVLAEVRQALAEDPNNFFQPTQPKDGRRTANTVQLMGYEQQNSPEEDDAEEDDTSEIPNSNTPDPDFERRLRSPRRGPDMSGAGLQK